MPSMLDLVGLSHFKDKLQEILASKDFVQQDAIILQADMFTNPTSVSSNASAVINAAIVDANTTGKPYVVIPPGEYWLTDTIYLKSNVILKGSGMSATTLKIADDCDIDAIRVAEPVNDSGIMDLTIDGNRIQNYSTYSNGHHGNAINVWLHYGRIERVRTNWVYKHSLLLNYDTGNSDDGLGFETEHQNDMGNLNKVLWCDFRDSLLQGVMWGWRTMDSWMCYTNIGSHAANLYLEGGTSRFIGNHFDGDGDNGAGPEYNVYCGDGCKAMVFEDNIFENTQKENIYFRQPSYSNETKTISIVNNIIRTCSKTANNTYANVYISGYDASVNAEQIVISGNQILNPDINGNHGYAGIHLNYCKDVKISGNTFFNVGADNVKLEDTCSNVIDDEHSSIMTGATSSVDGTTGLVPAPAAGDQGKVLLGNGTWGHTIDSLEVTSSFSMGRDPNTTVGTNSSAVGDFVEASGDSSHAEGWATRAVGSTSHAEGSDTEASGINAHAEGLSSIALGEDSHAEGRDTIAVGRGSHVSGRFNIADSYESWPEWVSGNRYVIGDKVKVTTTIDNNTTVKGYICIIPNSDNTFDPGLWREDEEMNFAEIVGNGTRNYERSNARTLDWNGNEWLAGDLTINGNTAYPVSLGSALSTLNEKLDEDDVVNPKYFSSVWNVKTWNGKLNKVSGGVVWTDGDNIYCSYYVSGLYYHYILDKATSTWSAKTWYGYKNFSAEDIWTDGENIYYSDGSSQYILDKSTSTWSTKTWTGLTSFDGDRIWTDGENIYYSYSSSQYVLDKTTSTWSTKTWSGLTSFYGSDIWTNGENIYYSYGSSQYVLNKAASTWSNKTWNGLTYLDGECIWTDGDNIYYSKTSGNRTGQYVLDKDTSTWLPKTWTGLTNPSSIWTDGENIYCSGDSENYVLCRSIFDENIQKLDTLGFLRADGVVTKPYENKPALHDGLDVSLVTTGEKDNWEHKLTSESLQYGIFEPKTWQGLSFFDGRYVWTDGDNTYYSHGTDHYVLDKDYLIWTVKYWYGSNIGSFNGNDIWTDGENIYLSSDSLQRVLNKDTSTWSTKTWSGLTSFNGNGIWTDGENIYYSDKPIYTWYQYVLDKATSTWSQKTWNGLANFYAEDVWTDGENIYYSYGPDQYVLDKATSTWSTKTWNGKTDIYGSQVWTDGQVFYHNNSGARYVLNKITSTWSAIPSPGAAFYSGDNVWTDGENTYCTSATHNYSYVFKKLTRKWGKTDTNLFSQSIANEYGNGTLYVWHNVTLNLAWISLRWTNSKKKINANTSITIGTSSYPFVVAQRAVGYATSGSNKYMFYMSISTAGLILVNSVSEIPQKSSLYADALVIVDA